MESFNSEKEIQLRRYRENLASSGSAYIIFGIWSAIRIVMELTMKSGTYEELISDIDMTKSDPDLVRAVMLVVIGVIIVFILGVHLHIGISAIRFSSGRKKLRGFLIPAAVIMLLCLKGISKDLTNDVTGAFQIDKAKAAEAIMDLTLAFVLFDIIYNVVRISMLRERGKAGGAG